MTTMMRSSVPQGAGSPWAPAVVGIYDDFITASISTTADAATWLLAGTSATAVLADSSRATDAKAGPGILTLTSNTTNQASLQLNGEPFRLVRGKRLWCGCRLALNDVDATQLWFGLSTVDSALLASAPNDYVGFLNTAATNVINTSSAKNGSATTTDSTKTWSTTDSTYRVLTFEWDGTRGLTYFVNGERVHQSVAKLQENNQNIPDDEDLTLGLEILGAAGESASIDYIYAFTER